MSTTLMYFCMYMYMHVLIAKFAYNDCTVRYLGDEADS